MSASPPSKHPPEDSPNLGFAVSVALNQVQLDAGTQSRLGGNDRTTVHRYAEAMQQGLWEFERSPLPLLFFDGSYYYPGDGHHRIEAARRSGLSHLPCDVKPGGIRAACFYSNTEANKYHGKQLTRQDKRNRVSNLLLDEEWQLMSDREIARQCGVSAPFVGTIRKSLVAAEQIRGGSKRKGRDGKVRDTKNIGRVKQTDSPPPEDPLPSPEISVLENPPAFGQGERPETLPQVSVQAESAPVDVAMYQQVVRERDALMQRLVIQQEQHKREIERLTAESLLGRNDELEQALADDEALIQQLYDGLGTIREALDSDRPIKDLRADVQRAARGIDLMRRILEAQTPNLLREGE